MVRTIMTTVDSSSSSNNKNKTTQSKNIEEGKQQAGQLMIFDHIQELLLAEDSKTLFATWYNDDGVPSEDYSFSRLWHEAGIVAYYLREKWGLKKGQKALLCYNFGLNFLSSFLGCLWAGVCAVITYPPGPPLLKSLPAFKFIADDCNAKVVLTDSDIMKVRTFDLLNPLSKTKHLWPKPDVLPYKNTEGLLCKHHGRGAGAEKYKWYDMKWYCGNGDESTASSGDLALIQYSSGSTSDPKGVMITHANLLANVSSIQKAHLRSWGQCRPEAPYVGVSWLPQYHDMGLIYALIAPFAAGWRIHLMSPIAFIKKPLLWLELISKTKATWSVAPDFAFRLVTRKFLERQQNSDHKDAIVSSICHNLDLSSLVYLMSAAEPIRESTKRRFEEVFGKYNLSKNWFAAGYGLAENVVFCSYIHEYKTLKRPDSTYPPLVAVGHRAAFPANQLILIVCPKKLQEVEDGQVGELWIAGPSVALGYYGKPDLTREVFNAMLPGQRDIRCSFVPDVEDEVQESSPVVRPGCVAAFSRDDGFAGEKEDLEIVFEIRNNSIKQAENACQAIKERITHRVGITPTRIVAIKEKTIAKTTSGKIRRRATRDMLHSDRLGIVFELKSPAGSVEKIVAPNTVTSASTTPSSITSSHHDHNKIWWSTCTRTPDDVIARLQQIALVECNERITPTQDLQTCFNSIEVVSFLARVNEELDVDLKPLDFFYHSSITLLADWILQKKKTPPRTNSVALPPASVVDVDNCHDAHALVRIATNSSINVEFSLLFFASCEEDVVGQGKNDLYRLYEDAAVFADQNLFHAIWTPERHFNRFGGLFPNPSVTTMLLAAKTKQIRLRAGSIVAPLNSPIRIAEEWACVDQASGGRVDLSFAAGWNMDDFCVAASTGTSSSYVDRKRNLFETIDQVRTLWNGGSIEVENGLGDLRQCNSFPRPVQKHLNVWVSVTHDPQTFWDAGRVGANILTALFSQSVDGLASKIGLYRESLRLHGFDPQQRSVTCMLHTFIGGSLEEAIDVSRGPFMSYLKDSILLWQGGSQSLSATSDEQKEQLVEAAFHKFVHAASLIGDYVSACRMVDALAAIGVTEIACLIDFGIAYDETFASLRRLQTVKEHFAVSSSRYRQAIVGVVDHGPSTTRTGAGSASKWSRDIAPGHAATIESVESVGNRCFHIRIRVHHYEHYDGVRFQEGDDVALFVKPEGGRTDYSIFSVCSTKQNFESLGGILEILVRKWDHPVVQHVCSLSAVDNGSTIRLSDPLRNKEARKCFKSSSSTLLFVAGTGIAKIFGLLKQDDCSAAAGERASRLFYSWRCLEDVCTPAFSSELTSFTSNKVTVDYFLTGPSSLTIEELLSGEGSSCIHTRRLQKEDVVSAVAQVESDSEDASAFIYGPPSYVYDTLIWIKEAGFRGKVFYESNVDDQSVAKLKEIEARMAAPGLSCSLTMGQTSKDDGNYKKLRGSPLYKKRVETAARAISVDDSNCFPLTRIQQRMYLADALSSGNGEYNTYYRAKLRVSPDIVRLTHCARALIRLHPTLCTRYASARDSGTPMVGVVDRKLADAFCITLIDQASTSEIDIHDFVSGPFDLLAGKSARMCYIAPSREVVVVFHHAAFDAASASTFFSQLAKLYAGVSLEEANPDYIDFAWNEFQREVDGFPSQSSGLMFWRKQLLGDSDDGTDDEVPLLTLPKDMDSIEDGLSWRPVIATEDLPPEFQAELRNQSKMLNISPALLCLVVFELVLKLFTNQEDIVVGVAMSIRRKGWSKAVGMFVNTIALRLRKHDAGTDGTFRALLEKRMLLWQDALCYAQVPFDLVSPLVRRREGLFQAFFNYLEGSVLQERTASDSSNFLYEHVYGRDVACKFPMEIRIEPRKITLVVAESVWGKEMVRCFLECYKEGLSQACTSGAIDASLTNLSFVSPKQRQFLSSVLRGPLQKVENELLLHQFFQFSAKTNPEWPAMRIGDKMMSYHQLEDASNRLAGLLLDQFGVQIEDRIGILLPRGFDQIVSMLGILKAGGAYVPLDDTYPSERINAICRDSKMTVCISSKSLGSVDYVETSKGVIVLEEIEWDAFSGCSIGTRARRENLCYVLYTSGSTGRPKGVEVEHRSVSNYCSFIYESLPKPRELQENVLLSSRLSWDVSVESIITAFVRGSCLCLVSTDTAKRLAWEMDKVVQRMDVTHLVCAPALVTSLLDRQSDVNSLTFASFNGDVLPPNAVRHLLNQNVCVVNRYGPTEATIAVTSHTVSSADPCVTCGRPVSIGRPLPKVQLYVLDAQLNQVPLGVAGELYIGGSDVLARGYTDPIETSKAFIPNPFFAGPNSSSWLYRTGDLVRVQPNGLIYFLGRKSSSSSYIKLRGFRIELEEISTLLEGHKDVIRAVALVEEKMQQIFAFASTNSSLSATRMDEELYGLCRSMLSDYMVPHKIVLVDTFPLDPNGKVDKKSLLGRIALCSPVTRQPIRASTELEILLLETLGSVIGVPAQSIEVNQDLFKTVGVNSLHVAQFALEFRRKKTRDLCGDLQFSAGDVYEHPTIQLLAEFLVKGRKTDVPEERRSLVEALLTDAKSGNFPESFECSTTIRRKVSTVSILLTGSTGYLGSFILRSLLLSPSKAALTLVVRANSPQQALIRVKESLSKVGLLSKDIERRLHTRCTFVCGDLSSDKGAAGLGDALADQTSCIIHAAAHVDHLKTYEDLKAANVDGTKRILKFARASGSGKLIPVLFMSTCGVFSRGGLITESDDASDQVSSLRDGYSQSKWVAEQICRDAQRRGFPVSIMRVGHLCPPAKCSGNWQTDSSMQFTFASIRELGMYVAGDETEPRAYFEELNTLPVDFASTIIIEAVLRCHSGYCQKVPWLPKLFSRRSGSRFKKCDHLWSTIHLTNPRGSLSMKRIGSVASASSGKAFQAVDIDAYGAAVLAQASDHKIHPKKRECYARFSALIDQYRRNDQTAAQEFDTAKLETLMSLWNIEWPLLSDSTIASYLETARM